MAASTPAGGRASDAAWDTMATMIAAPFPKIELHVHLEATVKPARLLEIARRNDVRLPAKTEAGLARFCRPRDFDHFIRVWIKTTKALRRPHDFHEVVVDYAADLAALSAAQGEVGPGKLLFTCFEGEVPEKYGWPTG